MVHAYREKPKEGMSNEQEFPAPSKILVQIPFKQLSKRMK